jgi:hypothetical protein
MEISGAIDLLVAKVFKIKTIFEKLGTGHAVFADLETDFKETLLEIETIMETIARRLKQCQQSQLFSSELNAISEWNAKVCDLLWIVHEKLKMVSEALPELFAKSRQLLEILVFRAFTVEDQEQVLKLNNKYTVKKNS